MPAKQEKNIIFALISPHPPLILPSIGSLQDRRRVKSTIQSLQKLGNKIKKIPVQALIISSPHPDWGINVPLYFLNPFKHNYIVEDYTDPENFILYKKDRPVIYPVLTVPDSPYYHFSLGKEAYLKIKQAGLQTGLIASGDLSHCLKQDGPYGFHEQGPQFDKELVKSLEKKNIKHILELDQLYPKAAECGLRSICFMLGILEESGLDYKINILSYQDPFGVGYLTAEFKIL